MGTTSIEWTKNADGSQGKVWNWARGCSRVSKGCERCYAERMAHRFSGDGQPYEGLTTLSKKGPRWVGEARFVREMLDLPLRTKKPTTWFTNSMSDPFHADLTFEQIAAVFAVMAATPQHTYQMLTKRPERAVEFFEWLRDHCGGAPMCGDEWAGLAQNEMGDGSSESAEEAFWRVRDCFPSDTNGGSHRWPLPNVWLGVSCEDQAAADERLPILLQLPASVRFVSAEPLLGSVDFSRWLSDAVHWIIAGGESGPGARPCNVDWIRSIVSQCAQAGVACFVKQLGAKPIGLGPGGLRDRKGGDIAEWPADLRVRQMPLAAAREAAE